MSNIPQRRAPIQARLLDHLVSVPHPCETDEAYTRHHHHQDLYNLNVDELESEGLRVELRLALDSSPDDPDVWLRERRAAVALHLRERTE